MAMSVFKDVADGSTVVQDEASGYLFVLEPGEWSRIAQLPPDEQEAAVRASVESARVSDAEKAAAQADNERYQLQDIGGRGDKEDASADGQTRT